MSDYQIALDWMVGQMLTRHRVNYLVNVLGLDTRQALELLKAK